MHPCRAPAIMRVYWHPGTLLHNPPHEILSGRLVPYLESPDRLDKIRQALEQGDIFDIISVEDDWSDEELNQHILAVHSSEYVKYLRTIYDEWVAIGGDRVCVYMHHPWSLNAA